MLKAHIPIPFQPTRCFQHLFQRTYGTLLLQDCSLTFDIPFHAKTEPKIRFFVLQDCSECPEPRNPSPHSSILLKPYQTLLPASGLAPK
jgi:hypothetical protein